MPERLTKMIKSAEQIDQDHFHTRQKLIIKLFYAGKTDGLTIKSAEQIDQDHFHTRPVVYFSSAMHRSWFDASSR
jgi:hypothetical protein